MAGAGKDRDYVVLEACLRRELRHQPILGGRDLLRGHEYRRFARLGRWGPSPTTSCGSHYGHAARVPETALVERESIGGEMIRLPAQHAFDRGLPGRQIEPGKAVDEICADIGEARGAGRVEGFARLRRGVEPIERGQDAVVEALDSEADPRDAGMPVAGEPLDADGFGIALHGD